MKPPVSRSPPAPLGEAPTAGYGSSVLRGWEAGAVSRDPRQVVADRLCAPAGRAEVLGEDPEGDQLLRVVGGPLAPAADPSSLRFVKERGSGRRRAYAVAYADAGGSEHLEFVGLYRDDQSRWAPEGGAGGAPAGGEPERDRPWANLGAWWDAAHLAAGGAVVGAGAEAARAVRLVLPDGTTAAQDAVGDGGVVLFLVERPVAAAPDGVPLLVAEVLDGDGRVLARHPAF